ncbi:MAG: DUF1963 domain-containing protein [Terriglobales bacterium]
MEEDEDAARARELLRRQASVAQLDKLNVGKRRSLLGDVGVIGIGEDWPSSGGHPMASGCQIKLDELPLRPAALDDLDFLCLYMALDQDGNYELPTSTPNGEGWELRAYERGRPLAEVTDQRAVGPLRPVALTFTPLNEDFPDWDDASTILDRAGIDRDHDWYRAQVGRAAEGIKVGGWPSLIQSEIFWAPWNRHPANPSFVMQIDSVPDIGLFWGDQGVLYIGRGDSAHRDQWALEWQCM